MVDRIGRDPKMQTLQKMRTMNRIGRDLKYAKMRTLQKTQMMHWIGRDPKICKNADIAKNADDESDMEKDGRSDVNPRKRCHPEWRQEPKQAIVRGNPNPNTQQKTIMKDRVLLQGG